MQKYLNFHFRPVVDAGGTRRDDARRGRRGRPLEDGELSAPSGTAPRSRHDPLAALRERDFLWFAASRLFSGTATMLLQAAIAWQVYEIAGSPLQLGLLGLARFLPALGMSLVGGAVADSYNRRTVLVLAELVLLGCGAVLLTATMSGWVTLPLIYGLVLVIALAAAFENPARQALLPLVVPREVFLNAVAVNTTVQQFGF
ncbi:MAG: MFS transporter, partial [Dehalococcoidia bacterium]